MTNTNSRAPAISAEIIEHLEKVFPDKLPLDPPTVQEVAHMVGQQKVIRHLRSLANAQNRTVLAGKA